jgi:hypothetical protein
VQDREQVTLKRLLLACALLGLSCGILSAREPCRFKIHRHERRTTEGQKKEAYRMAGIAWEDRHEGKCEKGCRVDHLIPLELAGLDDVSNLQIQTVPEAAAKDRVEGALARAVCQGRMSLEAAQRCVVRWKTCKIPLDTRPISP